MASRDIYQRHFDEDVQTSDRTGCPECDGHVTTTAKETVCNECGLLLSEQRIDTGPEWRSFPDEDDRERTGAPVTPARHDKGLTTEIGYGTDAKGNALGTAQRSRTRRLRREHHRTVRQTKREQNQMLAFLDVRRICSAMDLASTIRDQSCQLFRSAQDENLIQGRSLEAMAAASVYAACRCAGHPRTIEEIADRAQTTAEKVRNAYTVLNVELGLPTQTITPEQYVPRYASELNVGRKVERRARELVKRAISEGLANGRNPAGVAGACMLVAAEELDWNPLQREVAAVAGVTAPTLRKRRDEVRAVR
jgi:transcription initiation factor TFIIB